MERLAPGLGHLRWLEVLSLEGNEVGPEGAAQLAAQALPHLAALAELDLSRCGLDAAAAKELAPGLLQLRGLRSLRLAGCRFGTEGATALGAEALPHLAELRELDLQECELTRPAVEALARGLCRLGGLESVELRDKQAMGEMIKGLSLAYQGATPPDVVWRLN